LKLMMLVAERLNINVQVSYNFFSHSQNTILISTRSFTHTK